VSPAPEVFHRVVADVIAGLPNVLHYIDDILIFARTCEEHDRLVTEVLRRLRHAGFAVCKEKCTFGRLSLTFLGHHLSGSKISPDPLKLEALTCMQPPSSSAELFSFLGFVNYLARYVPRLAALAEPLRRLQSSQVHFEWTSEQDDAFRAIRQCLLDSPGLAPFDPALPLVIATDASNGGIGGVLLQNYRPVLYVARALMPAETRYAIIEKELLAVLFVLTRCHFYTFGRPVEVRTDHKPLLGLVRSDAEKLSPRIRRFVERMFPYALSWTYVPGKDHLFPDALSRIRMSLPLRTDEQREATWMGVSDQAFLAAIRGGGPIFQAIADATLVDLQFRVLMQFAAHGWPPKLLKRDARRHLLQPYWAIWHELRVVGPYLLWGHRICVRQGLHERALAVLHQGHPGINLMTQRAKNLFFWPGVTADIFRCLQQCSPCASNQHLPPREPLLHERPAHFPGEIVAADFFEYQRATYVAACDAFSNFLFCVPVVSISTQALLGALRNIFLQTGAPVIFASDGGPAFRSEEFQFFFVR
jgi:hypothetical protein